MKLPAPAVLIAFLIGLLVIVGLAWWRYTSIPSVLPGADWRVFKQRFVKSDGRVVDTGNGNITHSEGQGYGMLLAEAYGDRRTFDRIWTWTRENLQTRPGDRLLAWLWKPSGNGDEGAVADSNNASDGEILVAWALLRASKRWGNYDYQRAAAELVVELREKVVRSTPKGPVLLPGMIGFETPDGLVLNASYDIFPAFQLFAKKFPGNGWEALSLSGQNLVATARFGDDHLNPDWVLDSADGYSLKTQFPPDFGYNAVRIPLHIAWQNPKSPLLEPYAAFWKRFPDLTKMPATVNLATNQFGPDPSLPGMQAIARFVLACHAGERLTVQDIPPVTSNEPYFSASLKMLTKVAISEAMGGPR